MISLPQTLLEKGRNIELKARCLDLVKAEAAAKALGAIATAVLIQTDTYFHSPQGRLKLREIEGAHAELICYIRPDSPDFRSSDYYIAQVDRPNELKATLGAAMGLRGEVRKHRQLLLWHNVRIHLDRVERLGDFVEFEAVVNQTNDQALSRQRLQTLAAALSIESKDRVAVSYSDLLGL